jgi:hypothetical protein
MAGDVAMNKHWVLVGLLACSLTAADAAAQHQTPNQQPTTAPAPTAPTGAMALGTVRLTRAVMADGKPLPAGTYQVRLTAEGASPDAVGISESLERWAEFLQGGSVKGREIVTIVPEAEIKMVAKDAPPAPNSSKVQVLRGNEYVRVWIRRGGNYFLIHLPTGSATTAQ